MSEPTYIQTPDGIVNVLHLTDLHLYADFEESPLGARLHANFIDCLQQALAADIRCDLILITGDLVNEIHTAIYDRIYTILADTGIPFACMPGNHDVTDEIDDHLPFHERIFIAHSPDSRLLRQHQIIANDWQILLVDSSISGKVYGKIDTPVLQWLDATLSAHQNPAIILMHHHTLPIESEWLDEHISLNSDLFWQLLGKYPQVKVVANGHVHQESRTFNNGIMNYSTPATCYQFKRFSDEFAFDAEAKPGYRWIKLKDNAETSSWVERLQE